MNTDTPTPRVRKPRAAAELKVIRLRDTAPAGTIIDAPDAAARYWREHITKADWYDPDKEMVVALILDTRKQIKGHNLVSLGILDQSLIHAREVFRPIIIAGGHSFVMMHNHPSGIPTPSDNDVRATRELIRCGRLMHIELCDHVIVGTASDGQPPAHPVSMRQLGLWT